MLTHSTEKQRITNEYSLTRRVIETKNYGELTDHTIYWEYFLPMLVESKLKSTVKNYAKVPYKISIELDDEKLNYSEKEQQFFKDSVIQKSLSNGFTKEETDLYRQVTEDLIYLL